jgi:hypothetical protein
MSVKPGFKSSFFGLFASRVIATTFFGLFTRVYNRESGVRSLAGWRALFKSSFFGLFRSSTVGCSGQCSLVFSVVWSLELSWRALYS